MENGQQPQVTVSENGDFQVRCSAETQLIVAQQRLQSETGRLNVEVAQKDAVITALVNKIQEMEAAQREKKEGKEKEKPIQSGARLEDYPLPVTAPSRKIQDSPQA